MHVKRDRLLRNINEKLTREARPYGTEQTEASFLKAIAGKQIISGDLEITTIERSPAA
jgi:hypothetical protein